jgi:ABC-type sulfate transport system permease subunit
MHKPLAAEASAAAMQRAAQKDSPLVRRLAIGGAMVVVTWLIVLPVVNVFYHAFAFPAARF